MKKPIPTLLVLTALFLASCGGSPASSSTAPASDSSSQATSSASESSSESSSGASSSASQSSQSSSAASSSSSEQSSSESSSASSSESSSSESSSSSEPVATFHLTFDPNGGSASTTEMDVEQGQTAKLPVPAKEGKQFLGWYTELSEKGVKVTDGTPIVADMSLVAEWNEYDVDFLDGLGATFAHQAVQAGKYASHPSGAPTSAPQELPSGHFNGWAFDLGHPVHNDLRIASRWSDQEANDVVCTLKSSSYFSGSLDMVFRMKDSFFAASPTVFSAEMAKLSYGFSSATYDKPHTIAFAGAMGMNNLLFSPYFEAPTTTSIGFAIAHKQIGDKNLIAIAIRGHEYGQEWANNFLVGSTGDHEGFSASASKVVKAIEDYVKENYEGQDNVYWLTGYSRAGAVANLAANNMMNDTSGVYTENNLFTYTFDAPRGVALENASAWENVHNLVNEADLIARILPEEYGLTRAGVDVGILPDDVDAALKAVKEDFSIGTFTPTSTYDSEPNLATQLVNYLLAYGKEAYEEYKKEGGEKSSTVKSVLCDRDAFVENYQEHMQYILQVAFGLQAATRKAIIDNVKAKYQKEGALSILAILGDGESLYNYFKPFLDEDGYAYDPEKTMAACSQAALLMGPLFSLLPLFSDAGISGLPSVFSRLIAHHYPEVLYAFVEALK